MKQGSRGDITFQINNQEYTLIPTYLSLANIEKHLELSLIQIADLLNENALEVSQMIKILWYGLDKKQLPPETADNLEIFGEKIITLGISTIHNLTSMFIIEYFDQNNNDTSS